MNGILTTSFRAMPDSFEIYCGRVTAAVRELKARLQARYESRFPGEVVRIGEAIRQAEMVAGSGGGSDCAALIFQNIGG